ncbi:MAG: glycosyltransferase family 39 protein [Acidobacteria bacterium]|nr:glycosyltransferase family 39 protein [Acidobacteriota bacterium]
MPSSRVLRLVFLLAASSCVLAGVAARFHRFHDPWQGGHNGWGGAVYGLIAHNYVTHGFAATRLGPVANGGMVPPERFEYYYHHPPLQVWLLSLSYRIFGGGESSARAVPLAFSLASLLLVFLIARRWFGPSVAVLATVIFAVMPAGTYYGAHVEPYGSQALFFSLAAVYAYLAWLGSQARRDLMLCLAGVALGCLTSWYGYFLIPPLLLHLAVTRGPRAALRLWLLPLAALLLFAAFLAHRHLLLSGGPSELAQMGTLGGKLASRLAWPEGGLPRVALLTARWCVSLYTIPLCLLTLAWLAIPLRGRRATDAECAVLFFLAMGTLHNLAFPSMLPPHNYIVVAYAPAVAFASALTIEYVWRAAGRRAGAAAGGIVLAFAMALVVSVCARGTARHWQWDDVAEGRRLKSEAAAIEGATRPKDLVLWPGPDDYRLKVLRYYSRRNLVPEVLPRAGSPAGRILRASPLPGGAVVVTQVH